MADEFDALKPNEYQAFLQGWQAVFGIYIVAFVIFAIGSTINDDTDLIKQFLLETIRRPLHSAKIAMATWTSQQLSAFMSVASRHLDDLAIHLIEHFIQPYMQITMAASTAVPPDPMTFVLIIVHMLLSMAAAFGKYVRRLLAGTIVALWKVLVSNIRRLFGRPGRQ